MNIYILDIETKPNGDLIEMYEENLKAPSNIKDPVKIEAAIAKKKAETFKKMAVSKHYSEIACIGVKPLGEPGKALDLQQFADLLLSDDASFITFGGKRFDFPIIINNLVRHNIKTNYDRLKQTIKRWSSEVHVDLEELLSGTDYISLDSLAQIYLGKVKTPIDFETCTQEELEAHCIEDLELTEELYNKFEAVATFSN